MNKIKVLLLLVWRFGMWRGLMLFLKFQLGRVKRVNVPRIKHPIALRNNSSDIPTFCQVFLEDYYLLRYADKPRVVIDGGANVGLFGVKVKNDFPDAKLICIEPDPENFEMLQKNMSVYTEVYLENSGLWNKDTRLKIYDKYDLGKWGMTVEEDLEKGKINAISLKSLLKKYNVEHIDILKLDIETSEKQLFSEGYEEWLPKVRTIIIELHDWIEAGCSKPFFEAINKSFKNYKYAMCGENTIITNCDLDK